MNMQDLDCYTFAGKRNAMTYFGPKSQEIAFSLILAPDADEWLVNTAAKVLSTFLIESAKIEDEYGSLN